MPFVELAAACDATDKTIKAFEQELAKQCGLLRTKVNEIDQRESELHRWHADLVEGFVNKDATEVCYAFCANSCVSRAINKSIFIFVAPVLTTHPSIPRFIKLITSIDTFLDIFFSPSACSCSFPFNISCLECKFIEQTNQ